MSQASWMTHVVPSRFSWQAALMHATMSSADDLGLPTAFLTLRYHPFDHCKGQDPATSLAGGLRHATTKLGQAFCLLKTPLEFDDLISQQQGIFILYCLHGHEQDVVDAFKCQEQSMLLRDVKRNIVLIGHYIVYDASKGILYLHPEVHVLTDMERTDPKRLRERLVRPPYQLVFEVGQPSAANHRLVALHTADDHIGGSLLSEFANPSLLQSHLDSSRQRNAGTIFTNKASLAAHEGRKKAEQRRKLKSKSKAKRPKVETTTTTVVESMTETTTTTTNTTTTTTTTTSRSTSEGSVGSDASSCSSGAEEVEELPEAEVEVEVEEDDSMEVDAPCWSRTLGDPPVSLPASPPGEEEECAQEEVVALAVGRYVSGVSTDAGAVAVMAGPAGATGDGDGEGSSVGDGEGSSEGESESEGEDVVESEGSSPTPVPLEALPPSLPPSPPGEEADAPVPTSNVGAPAVPRLVPGNARLEIAGA